MIINLLHDHTTTIQPAISYLYQQQTETGHWGNVDKGPGRTALTANILHAIAKADAVDEVKLTSSLNWLAARQQADGGFGDNGSTVLDMICSNAENFYDNWLAIANSRSAIHLRVLAIVNGN